MPEMITERTPLHYAAQCETLAIVTALANVGIYLNTRDIESDWVPLHLTAWFSKTLSVTAALIIAGADSIATDKAGKTP